ncbi:ImmA/IrrE family metallo-endopeptidase [Clavibacter michiganensis]|uniref:ImmA/IrrE family metallo-endopeptidase n=1 Tax=Clavibacter michiganensis TaxID=28447 RepID=UPI0026DCF322|nr:ImmA/IrrE family metallo-endopeptidase [Clavibacter michiganensis]MDO4144209.1 ImmA/IrrE family metallo-endopeptidase [Clavibacter michiganensis]
MPRTFDAASAQVDAMIAVWTARGGDVEALTLDAIRELQQRTDLTLAMVPEFVPRQYAEGCSVAGGYRWDPPTLLVTESMSTRRQQFTALHELGHHLQKTDMGLGTTIVEHDHPEEFEDACCDAFAARILLPDDLVALHTPPTGPTAIGAVELFHSSNASRAAICVRLAGALQSPGVVAVLNRTGTVSFAAARGGMLPPARDSDQRKNPLVSAALATDTPARAITRDNAQIWYRTGQSSNRLYGQAAWSADHLFLVQVEYGASWLHYSPPRDGTAERTTDRWDQCEHCGASFTITFTCQRCRQPRCPAGHCSCTAASLHTCHECFLEKTAAQFPDGSTTCSDCLL